MNDETSETSEQTDTYSEPISSQGTPAFGQGKAAEQATVSSFLMTFSHVIPTPVTPEIKCPFDELQETRADVVQRAPAKSVHPV